MFTLPFLKGDNTMERITTSCTWGSGSDVLLTVKSLSDTDEVQLSSGQAKSIGYGLILAAKKAERLERDYQESRK